MLLLMLYNQNKERSGNMAKKHSDTKQFLLCAAITLAAWVVGVLAAGRIPFFVDYVYLPTESGDTFKLLYPFLLLVYLVVFAVICKRKDKDAMFFGSYLFLIIPSATFLFLWINQYAGLGLENYVSVILLLLLIPAMPLLSVFDAFFAAFYGSIRPIGFSNAHIIFGIAVILASVLPPIIYKLVKSKQQSVE